MLLPQKIYNDVCYYSIHNLLFLLIFVDIAIKNDSSISEIKSNLL